MRKLLSLFIVGMIAAGMSTSAMALDKQNSEIVENNGAIEVDLTTSEVPDSITVTVDGEQEATMEDFTEISDTQYSLALRELQAGDRNVVVDVVESGSTSTITSTVELVDVFTTGEDVERTLTVTKDADAFADGLGIQSEDQGQQDTLVEAYSKVVLIEGTDPSSDDAEVIWEGTPSLLSSGDPWDKVNRNARGNITEEHTFTNTFYNTGEYSYVYYLASAHSEYDPVDEQWEAPTTSGSYDIQEEDYEVYPFRVVQPEEPPSAFEALAQFFDSQVQGLFNFFRG